MPTPYSPGAGSENPRLRAFALEKGVRNLDQDARAVAGLRIAAAGAAMRQIDQNLDALQDDIVRLPALDIGDKADAAGVVLVLRAVKSLSRRQASKWVEFTSCEPELTIQGLQTSRRNAFDSASRFNRS